MANGNSAGPEALIIRGDIHTALMLVEDEGALASADILVHPPITIGESFISTSVAPGVEYNGLELATRGAATFYATVSANYAPTPQERRERLITFVANVVARADEQEQKTGDWAQFTKISTPVLSAADIARRE